MKEGLYLFGIGGAFYLFSRLMEWLNALAEHRRSYRRVHKVGYTYRERWQTATREKFYAERVSPLVARSLEQFIVFDNELTKAGNNVCKIICDFAVPFEAEGIVANRIATDENEERKRIAAKIQKEDPFYYQHRLLKEAYQKLERQ